MNIKKLIGLTIIIVISSIIIGCSSISTDKFEGFWVSENVITYDYNNYKYSVIPLDQMPYDIFSERWIVFFKIEKKDNKYVIHELSHHFEAINRSAGDYVNQINNLREFNEQRLDQGQYDPDAVVEGDIITLNGKHTVHIKRNIKEGNKTKNVTIDVKEKFKLGCDNNSLIVKDHYYETTDGKRIDIPQNDIRNLSKKFKRMTIAEFKELYNNIQKKAIEIATNS